MTGLTLKTVDGATSTLRAIAAQLKNPIALYKDVGRRVANDLRKHYKARDAAQPNALGGKRTHFWLDVRDGVQQPQLVPGGVDIVIQHYAIAQKIFGGRITAKNARALTIPLIALAHGRRASVFEAETGYKLFHPKGTNVLMADIGNVPVAVYALVGAVNVPRDPHALPEESAMVDAIVGTARAHLSRIMARQ